MTLISDALGRSVRLRVSANAFKTVDHRGGLDAFLAKAKDAELSPKALELKRQIKKKKARGGGLTPPSVTPKIAGGIRRQRGFSAELLQLVVRVRMTELRRGPKVGNGAVPLAFGLQAKPRLKYASRCSRRWRGRSRPCCVPASRGCCRRRRSSGRAGSPR